MKKIKTEHSYKTRSDEDILDEERRNNDRRLCEKNGFAYIPIVGWMCRREKPRRKDDNVCGW